MLDLVETLTNAALPSAPVVDNDYDSVGNLTRVAAFNREQRTMTWRGDGTLQTVKVGPNTTTLGIFKRGVPQSVAYPDTTSVSAVIDDAGDIRSATDENGFTTSYGYDALRRLTRIDYPADDTVNWLPTLDSVRSHRHRCRHLRNALAPDHEHRQCTQGRAL